MNNPLIRFVIIGSGNISSTYVRVINEIENAQLAGFISRSSKEKLEENYNIAVAEKLHEFKEDFDAVIICTPNGLHHKTAIEAAKMGKHVLTEKPLDISLNAINLMINYCKNAGVKLGVAYQRRFSPDNKIIKKIITEGKLGKIFSVDLRVKNYRDQNYYDSSEYRGTWEIDGGGPFIQQASHYIDLYSWFFGAPDKVVSSYDTFVHKIETEDHGVALLRHSNGMIGTIVVSTAAKPGFDARFEIHSEKGTVFLENDAILKWLIDGIENPSKSVEMNINSGAASAFVTDISGHKAVVADFINSINYNVDPFITGESAKISTELILRIYSNKIF